MQLLEDKILGSLLGAAIGDAMGAATELRSKALIRARFGGEVRDMLPAPDDTFARGAKAGSVTDDFSQVFYTARAILANGGVIDSATAEKAILDWAEDEKYYNQYVGPTTRAAVERLKGVSTANPYAFICCDNAKASNGSAMKIAPAGLFNPGDIEQAIVDAITLCRPTHNNNLSISGACAVAAAVSEAMKEDATVFTLVQAALYGANRGMALSEGTCSVLAGPDVAKRIKLAVSIGMTSSSTDSATTEIADVVGSGLHISEAVPAVLGICVAAAGDPMEGIYAAVNIGSDTDTIASMTGAILGALHGSKRFPDKYVQMVEEANGFDIQGLASGIAKLVAERGGWHGHPYGGVRSGRDAV